MLHCSVFSRTKVCKMVKSDIIGKRLPSDYDAREETVGGMMLGKQENIFMEWTCGLMG